MVSDVAINGRFEYDGDHCFSLWLQYCADVISMNDFLLYLKRYPILRLRRQRYHRKLTIEVCEDLVQAALTELWRLAAARKLPMFNVAVFHGYLNTVIARKFSKVFSSVYDDSARHIDPHIHMARYLRRQPSANDVETVLYVDELPVVIRKAILSNLRFTGENVQGAVKYILDRIFNGEDVVTTWLRREYAIDDPEFLVEHVRIRIKMTLHKLSKDVKFQTSSDQKEILSAAFADYLAN